MKKTLLYLLPLLLFVACENTSQQTSSNKEESNQKESQVLSLDIQKATELAFENLQVYPVIADETFFKENETAKNMKNLKEGMETKGFYVTEKKPYGRRDDASAVNKLTVQNKSNETVYLMQGDVVSGGNQDRILAENRAIPPRTITDINVFCVEEGRWAYQSDNETDDAEAKHKRKIYAFSGYYNLASTDLRKTVRNTQNQNAVWEKVGQFTNKNNAKSSTKTYTALEDSEDFTKKRETYLAFFEGKLQNLENCVGFVVVSGKKVVATDIFGHPALFQKQSEALLHSYITEAITNGQPVSISTKTMQKHSTKMNKAFNAAQKENDKDKLYQYNQQFIHYSEL